MSRHRLAALGRFGGLLAAVALALGFIGSGSAFASELEPWWHLVPAAAPAVLQPGQAQDEVWELTVSATSGSFALLEEKKFAVEFFPWDATDQEVKEGLERLYASSGSGTVEVTGGPGDEAGTKPYRIKFVGPLASQPVAPLNASFSGSFLGCQGAAGTACRREATIVEKTVGRSDGQILLTAANLGDADLSGSETPIEIADKLPPGLDPVSIEGEVGGVKTPMECSVGSVSCTFGGVIPPYEEARVTVDVDVRPGAATGENEMTATGGNATAAKAARPVAIGNSPTPFGVENYELSPEDLGGAADTQAGSHPFQLTTVLNLDRRSSLHAADQAKDLEFKLPAGLIGNPTPLPRCSLPHFLLGFLTNTCPNDTAIGAVNVRFSYSAVGGFEEESWTVPLFNLVPSVGEPARFGFMALGNPVLLDTSVRTGGDYGVTVSVKNITQAVEFMNSRVTFWGVPGDRRHDGARGWSCVADEGYRSLPQVAPCVPTNQPTPPSFLELPTSCTGPMQTTVEAESWQDQGVFSSYAPSVPLPALDGCNALPFSPSIVAAPDSEAANTPTGLTVGIHLPQEVSLDAGGLGESDVKNTTVTLPAGVALSPAAADGLQACSEAGIALPVDSAPTCPDASKVGTVEIKTPLLPNPLTGAVYLAQQSANPFGSLIALYVVAQDPVSGTLIKLAGEVVPDERTGQLVSSFKNTPQLPFEDFEIHFFGGARAPLTTPPTCGSYTTSAAIEGWSGNPPTTTSSRFNVATGQNGSPCADPLPFSPELAAGSSNIEAGAFTPFTMTMSRPDGDQNLAAIELKMPPGLLGTLSNVKLCGEPAASQGLCGAESLIGETTISVGLGGDPYTVTGGKVYITEGYGGAPYGLSIVNPAKAGPFDLGKGACDCVVVRAKIEVDPITAALTVTTDTSGPYKIPEMLDGIPLEIKHINVTINRQGGFTFNPTNCEPMQIAGALTSSQDVSSALHVSFQATNCATLAFKPRFTASTNGKTSRAGGASLDVKLTYPNAPWGSQANVRSVKVSLPKVLPSRLSTLQHACLESTFERNPAACPAASQVGSAVAHTPIIPVALAGPAYFVSYGNAKFPELVIVLSGYGVSVQLHGETFISKAGITSSTFKTVPDVPIGSFELKLPQGSNSALAANGKLCGRTVRMPTVFVAQNGLEMRQATPIAVTHCSKRRATGRHRGGKHTKRRKA